MGWTCNFVAKHWKFKNGHMVVDRQKCVDDLFTFTYKDENGIPTYEYDVLKSAMRGKIWYGAIRRKDLKDGSIQVVAGVTITKGKGADGTIWGYKEMDETYGPYCYDCPKTILDLLTPTDNETANQWREECRKKIVKKKSHKCVTPNGITMRYRGGWIISSPEYIHSHYYSGVRYCHIDCQTALDRFITDYGTENQKKEWEVIKKSA